MGMKNAKTNKEKKKVLSQNVKIMFSKVKYLLSFCDDVYRRFFNC